MKFPAPCGPVLTNISKCHNFFLIFADLQKGHNLYSLMTNILTVKLKFGWNQMKTGRGVEF